MLDFPFLWIPFFHQKKYSHRKNQFFSLRFRKKRYRNHSSNEATKRNLTFVTNDFAVILWNIQLSDAILPLPSDSPENENIYSEIAQNQFTGALKKLAVFRWIGKLSPIFCMLVFRLLLVANILCSVFFLLFFLAWFASSLFAMSCMSFAFVSIFNLFESSFLFVLKTIAWKTEGIKNTTAARQREIMVIEKWRFAQHANPINR